MDELHSEIEQLKMKIAYLEDDKEWLKTSNQNLNLKLKYALFDAEALKREKEILKKEKEALKRLLDEKHK